MIFNFIFNFKPVFFSTTFCISYSIASVFIYLLRPSPVTVPHPTWLRACTDSSMHVDKIAPWTVKESSCIYLVRPWQLDHPSIRRLVPDFTSCYRFSPNHTHFTCLNFICQHSAIVQTTVKQRSLACIWCQLPILGKPSSFAPLLF